MANQPFSLFHHAAPPKNGLAEKPPLLILLHGFGANEDDLFSLAPYLDERLLIVSPRAPVTVNAGAYAWFSLGFTPDGVIINEEEAENSRRIVRKFIDEVVEHYHADPRSVYLMGFSQGAMISMAVALIYPGCARAVVAMSGRLLPQTVLKIEDKDELIGLPIFVVHGTRDPVLPIHHGRATKELLSELPVDLTYREYEMGHEVSVESLEDVVSWLKYQLDQAEKESTIN